MRRRTLTREGKAYVTKTEDGTMTMRFMPLGDDLYLAESSAEQKGKTMRLYGVVKLDKAKHLAMTYKTVAHDGDIGPGLPACKADKTGRRSASRMSTPMWRWPRRRSPPAASPTRSMT